ncbi:Holliday junction branch migration protein RuvA [Zhaonella formicivorans]|jgi:Holliday junction DNA helicase RuvA|uniref:Holliday junction branch migration protein RuvA n=1 Tax=Zhaonella formicivorans TaxID=2528593 RepID=UPI0010E2B5EE|nr:Holliday junction branch migration protein RuvA [Zhaonella formicivorans]
MIAFLRGKVVSLGQDNVIVEVNGVGYQVSVPANIVYQLPPAGEEVVLHTYFHIREDQVQLFGFTDASDKEIFELLLEVSGVGPKVALGILAAIEREKLVRAIMEEQLAVLTQLPGIGKKTAQRLILELKDKIAKSTSFDLKERVPVNQTVSSSYGDALAALLSLGYSQKEIEPRLQAVLQNQRDEMSLDQLIKLVLKEIAKM